MQVHEPISHTSPEPLKAMLKRFCIVVVFSIAFGYIEAAVVVYLRTIFHPSGFTFPLTEFGISPLWKRLLLTETGREAATLVLMLTAACLFGKNNQQRFAFFLTIFAVWDIFYYIWLKVLIDWPNSIMDWDILFLIPTAWAGPLLAPVLISIILLLFAVIILYEDSYGKTLNVKRCDWLGFILAGLAVVASFGTAGLYITKPDYKDHFYWSLFGLGNISAIAIFLKCLLKSK
jgi:hypothetical protein